MPQRHLILFCALLLVFLWIAARTSDPRPPQVAPEMQTEILARLTRIRGGELASQIKPGTNAGTLLFIYTSWCPYCKKAYPKITALARKYAGNITPVALSMDTDEEALAAFLSSQEEPPFLLLIPREGEHQGVMEELTRLSPDYAGGVPYVMVLDREGQLFAEFQGITETSSLENSLKKLTKSP